MKSPYRIRYDSLVKAQGKDSTSFHKRVSTLRAFVERNRTLHEIGRQVLYYGITARELRKAIEGAKIDADFDRRFCLKKPITTPNGDGR